MICIMQETRWLLFRRKKNDDTETSAGTNRERQWGVSEGTWWMSLSPGRAGSLGGGSWPLRSTTLPRPSSRPPPLPSLQSWPHGWYSESFMFISSLEVCQEWWVKKRSTRSALRVPNQRLEGQGHPWHYWFTWYIHILKFLWYYNYFCLK